MGFISLRQIKIIVKENVIVTIISSTLTFAIGIIWGLYIDKIMLIVPIFLFITMLIILSSFKFYKISKYIISAILLFSVFITGSLYTSYRFNKFSNKYTPRQC